MNKQEIYKYLDEKNIWYEITNHKAVYNMAELADVEMPYPTADAKNLFVRDDKKRNYYLITIKGDRRVDLKDFRKKYNTRPLSFASENDMQSIIGLTPGSVTPFGVLNDQDRKVKVFIEESFYECPGIVGVHPNDNTATIWIKTNDLAEIIKEHGNEVFIMEKEWDIWFRRTFNTWKCSVESDEVGILIISTMSQKTLDKVTNNIYYN